MCIRDRQLHRRQRHPSAPDVFGEGDACHIREHPLKVISRTAGYLRCLLKINLLGDMLFDIAHCLIKAFYPLHLYSSCLYATYLSIIHIYTAKLRRLQETGDKTAGRLLRMAEEPAGFLSTIQIGITLAGFLGSAFAAENFSDSLTNWIYNGLGFQYLPVSALDTVSVIVITIILSYFTLIFGELVPKRIAMQKPYRCV